MSFADNLKQISIVDYASRTGYTPVRKGNKYVSLKEHDSVRIDTQKNCFWRNSVFSSGNKNGAGSIIDFVMEFENVDMKTAMRKLAVMYDISEDKQVTNNNSKIMYGEAEKKITKKVPFIIPTSTNRNTTENIESYLEKRGISPNITKWFIDNDYLYEDSYRNCVFHTKDFACIRGTNFEKRFVKDVEGSNYDTCFFINNNKNSNGKLIVTESVIDTMSVMTYLQAIGKNPFEYSFIALSGTNKLKAVANNLLATKGKFNQVFLCLDNDTSGQKAVAKIQEDISSLDSDMQVVTYYPSQGKDWNEFILEYYKKKEREGVNLETTEKKSGNYDTIVNTVGSIYKDKRIEEMNKKTQIKEQSFTYYTVNRPVSIGTYPKDGLIDFTNYEDKSFVSNIYNNAWGELHYSRELTQQEIASYELVKERASEEIARNSIAKLIGELANSPVNSIIEDLKNGEFEMYQNYLEKKGATDLLASLNDYSKNQSDVIEDDVEPIQELKPVEEPVAAVKESERKRMDIEDEEYENLNPQQKLLADLEQGITDIMNSDNFKSYLDTSSRLYHSRYSVNNTLLIYFQKPNASYVMGYEKWKEYGRQVDKGAKSCKILMPKMAYESQKGGLYKSIVSGLNNARKNYPNSPVVIYRLGNSEIEFTQNQKGQNGLMVKGKEIAIFKNSEEMQRFIDNNILNKMVVGYKTGMVFDVSDTIVPEFLWTKQYTKNELVLDENNKPTKTFKGEYKIYNTQERQNKFNTTFFDTQHSVGDPEKMKTLFDVLKQISEKNGIPVSVVDRNTDEILKDGADGYFSRKFSEIAPKGYIVIPVDLETTQMCSVMLHEMAHSDMHRNLAKLEQQMGEKSTTHSREIQAEAVAYTVGRHFNIETDVTSFKYLANFSRGFELQDLKKSIDLIHTEAKTLTAEIEAELDVKGLNLDLSEKNIIEPLSKQSVEVINKRYAEQYISVSQNIDDVKKELPQLALNNKDNGKILQVLKEQKLNVDRQVNTLDVISSSMEALKIVGTREEQNKLVEIIDTAYKSIENDKFEFEKLSVSFVELSQKDKTFDLKKKFRESPHKVLSDLKTEHSNFNPNSVQIDYLASSNFVSNEIVGKTNYDKNSLVNMLNKRLQDVDKVVSKNGTFVEIVWCEQWTEQKIFNNGTLCHPKVADTIVKQAEAQILKLKNESTEEYVPCTKCNITIYTIDKDKQLTGYNTRCDIGDGYQTSLTDFLKKECKNNVVVVENFSESTREQKAKDKLVEYISIENDDIKQEEHTIVKTEQEIEEKGMSSEDWNKDISQAKENDNRGEEKENIGKKRENEKG